MSVKKSKKVNLRQLFNILLSKKNMKDKDLAEKVGVKPCTVSNNLKLNKMNLVNLKTYLKAVDEPVVIVLKNGDKYELDIN